MRLLGSANRRQWCLLALVGVLAAAFALTWLTWPIRIEDRVQRIRPGMTLGEVEEIVQASPGDHTRYVSYAGTGGLRLKDDKIKEWSWDEGVLKVEFDEDGHVLGFSFWPNPDVPTALERLRDELPW